MYEYLINLYSFIGTEMKFLKMCNVQKHYLFQESRATMLKKDDHAFTDLQHSEQ